MPSHWGGWEAILPVQQSGAACDLTLPLAGGRLRDVLFGDVWCIPDICHFFYMDRIFRFNILHQKIKKKTQKYL